MSLQPLELLVTYLQGAEVARYTTVATLGLLVYEWFITLDDEVSFIWSSRITWAKGLFLLTRYLPFVDVCLLTYAQISVTQHSNCLPLYRAATVFIEVGFAICEIILLIRTWAIWDRTKRMFLILSCLFFICLVAASYFVYKGMNGFLEYPVDLPGCYVTISTREFYADILVILILETVGVSLLIIKNWNYMRNGHRSPSVQSMMLSVMFRDGVVYFALILITSVTNIAVMLTVPIYLSHFFILTQRVLHGVLGTRALLHIHEASKLLDAARQFSFHESMANSVGVFSATYISGMEGFESVQALNTDDVELQIPADTDKDI